MPTPVGPAPRDPNDPDLLDDWYGEEGDDVPQSGFRWPIRLIALLVALGIVSLLVFARWAT